MFLQSSFFFFILDLTQTANFAFWLHFFHTDFYENSSSSVLSIDNGY